MALAFILSIILVFAIIHISFSKLNQKFNLVYVEVYEDEESDMFNRDVVLFLEAALAAVLVTIVFNSFII